jgi:membrane fusion protein (multidrug efflux system)
MRFPSCLARRCGMAAFAAACVALVSCRRPAAPPTTVPTVEVLRVEPRELAPELVASGVIEAVDKVQAGFMVPGRVARVAVEDGETVAAGQLLAQLEDADYRDALAAAEAKFAEVSARHERLKKLHELGSLTATDFEKIASGLAEARSGVELARRRLDYTQLKAPFAGRVVRHGVAAGSVVGPGLPVVSVLAPAPVWAVLSVPEVDAPRVQPGQPARVNLAAAGGTEVHGEVETVLPQAEPLSRSFAVKIRLANADGRFRPGNIVTARITAGEGRRALSLPPQVIQRYPDGGLYVWTVDVNSKTVARRIVGIGRVRETEVEIVAGLEAGALVVRGGTVPLFDGMAVNVAQP